MSIFLLFCWVFFPLISCSKIISALTRMAPFGPGDSSAESEHRPAPRQRTSPQSHLCPLHLPGSQQRTQTLLPPLPSKTKSQRTKTKRPRLKLNH